MLWKIKWKRTYDTFKIKKNHSVCLSGVVKAQKTVGHAAKRASTDRIWSQESYSSNRFIVYLVGLRGILNPVHNHTLYLILKSTRRETFKMMNRYRRRHVGKTVI